MSFLKLDDYTVPGFGLNVGISAPLKDEDASGESSSTARAKKGNKGKKLEVRLSLRFTDADALRELMRVAEATEGSDGKVYTITNDTANTAGMRQARFTGTIRADEAESLRLWQVSFTLIEHISVPEMAEARQTPKGAASQQNEGAGIGGDAPPEGGEKLSWFERNILKPIDQKIGPAADA
jgi:hypothetical protein